jgi:molybdate transport system substrate-binding protein
MNRSICKLALLLVSASVTLSSQEVTPKEISVAAASDLQFVFKEVAARFEKATGNTVKLSFGSSGNFFSQIQNGAPYDLFFSADFDYPQKLDSMGLVESGTLQQYATGKLVLWTANDSGLDLGNGLSVLLEPKVKKIAVANPIHAPYGRAAVAALKSAGIYDKVADRLIYGENVSQAAQFASSGNAQVGILALSIAVSPMMKSNGKYFVLNENSYPRMDQAVVVLKSSKQKEIAECFMDFIKGAGMTALMRRYGFELADDPVLASKMPMRKTCPCWGRRRMN